MNKKLIVILAAVAVVAAAAVCIYYFGNFWREVVYDNANQNANQNTNEPLIGGQKDAHGCLVAAGYSWCEPKQKCLRVWEERCYEAEEAALAQIFASEHEETIARTHVRINVLQNNFAAGGISFGEVAGEGGAFLARLADGAWAVDYEGNGSIDCPKVRDLGYPEEVLVGFCDVICAADAKLCSDGSYVGRVAPNCEFALCPGENKPTFSEAEARAIAEASCIKGGEALGSGIYNENTKTWWFDANLNATREGCNPACVVDEVTKTAEINWRCTGLIVPEKESGE